MRDWKCYRKDLGKNKENLEKILMFIAGFLKLLCVMAIRYNTIKHKCLIVENENFLSYFKNRICLIFI